MSKEDYLYILELIPTGSDKPVQLPDLAYYTNFEERTVKRMIQQLRLDGYPIISHPDGGYFIPYRYSSQDMWLANKFVSTMKAQAYSRIKVADALVDSIASLELGQVSFDD